MKAVVNYERGKVEMRELPKPKPGPGEVLMRVKAVGVCGSDVHQWHGTAGYPIRYPVTLGHEFAGEVAELGEGVTGWQVGDRVVSETASYVCGECAYCRKGMYNLCPTRRGFGAIADGAMAEYVPVRTGILHRLPDSMEFELAAMTEPCCVAYNCVADLTKIQPGDHVAIFGPGPIGLLCLMIAKLFSPAELILIGTQADEERLRLGRELGATRTLRGDVDDIAAEVKKLGDGYGVDVVIDAVGVSATLKQSLEICRPAGQISKVGWGPAPVGFSIDPLVQKAISLQGSFSHNWTTWERVLRLFSTGLLDPRPLMQTFSLEQWEEAFQGMSDLKIAKSVLRP